jgi:hypothetical protein
VGYRREVLLHRKGIEDAADAARLLVHRTQQRHQLGFDLEASRDLSLRAVVPPLVVERPVDEDEAMVEIDVRPTTDGDLRTRLLEQLERERVLRTSFLERFVPEVELQLAEDAR